MKSRDGRSEFSSAGTKPGEAARERREMHRERAGQTGGYVDPAKFTEVSSPGEDAYEEERLAALADLILRPLRPSDDA